MTIAIFLVTQIVIVAMALLIIAWSIDNKEVPKGIMEWIFIIVVFAILVNWYTVLMGGA